MEDKLEVGDDVVIYGFVYNVDGVAKVRNAIIVRINGLLLEDTFKLAKDLINADTCTEYELAPSFKTRYDALSEDNKEIFDGITISCKANENDNELTGSVKLSDKLSYMISLKAADVETFETIANKITAKSNTIVGVIIGVAALLAIAFYYLIGKKKFARQ